MLKDIFPVKLLFRPGETFAGIAAGNTGWGWPLALYCASAVSSALLLYHLPPEFLAEAAGGAELAAGKSFWWYLAVGLPGGFGFTLFFCALLAAFLPFLRSGRLPLRLACLALGTAAYGFFFLLPFKGSPAYAGATWLLAGLAAGGAFRAAQANERLYLPLVKTALALSVITLAADAAGAAAVLAGSQTAFSALQYALAALALVYLVRACAALAGTTTARAAAAAVPAMLAGAAFLFSLSALGLLPPEIFQALLLI